MKRRNLFVIGAVLAVMLTGLAFLSISSGVNEKTTEKTLQAQPPISFDLRLPYTVKQKISQKIQEDNSMLSTLLENLRSASLDKEEGIASEAQILQDKFKSTYLTKAKLIMDDGRLPHEGWNAIVRALKDVAIKGMEISVQSVEVQAYYVPYAKASDPKVDTDMKFLIRTTVIMGPHNDIFEGWLCHRRTCDPIPCEEGI